jgi:alpha-L-fucosidase
MTKTEYLKHIDEVIANGFYKDNWDSMKSIDIPGWYNNAKFGIFIHWGLYSVPAFGSEWYSRNMYRQGSKEYEHHLKTYGAHKDFGYKDFIPLFKAEKFNANEWMDLFSKSGARYVTPVAEHHDGFQMYKSNVSKFNAFEMGPKRDVVGELMEAAQAKGIQLGVSSHRIEHWFFMGHGKAFESDIKEPLQEGDFYWAAQAEPKDHFDLYESAPSTEFMEDWLVRCCELVDTYEPSLFYFDWWIQIAALKPYLKKFAAYYYNKGMEWGTPAVINYKHDAFAYGCAVLDIERGQLANIKPKLWQTDTSVAKNSWCYTENNAYKTSREIICDMIDIVSKNGCLMLNIGPKADGTIPDEDKRILLEIGDWLKINGEAIYNTSYFRTFGEGSTEIKEGQFTDSVAKEWTTEDIRFTMNGSTLYAAVMKYPEDGIVRIKSLAVQAQDFSGIIKDIGVLGFDEKPEFERTKELLMIKTKKISSLNPVVFKITID